MDDFAGAERWKDHLDDDLLLVIEADRAALLWGRSAAWLYTFLGPLDPVEISIHSVASLRPGRCPKPFITHP